jgi:peptidoglycan-associated lipoprotein
MFFWNKMLLFIAMLLIVHQLLSQPLNRPSRQMNIDAAEQALADKNYYGAIDFFRDAYNEEKDDDIYRKMAFCYYKIRDYKRATLYYNRLLRKQPAELYSMYYEWGRMNKMMGDYEQARKAFRPALASPVDSLRWLTEQELKGMVIADDMRENPKFKVVNAGDRINRRFGELSPAMGPDTTLYFSEIDANRAIEVKPGKKTEAAKIHRVKLTSELNAVEKELLESPINEGNYDVGNISFSPDGLYMYYNRVNLKNNQVQKTDLFVSKQNDAGEWLSGQRLAVPENWNIRQPAFGLISGKSVLFFTAEMPGGFGGLDIYYAPLERNGIGTPINLGAKINTPGDEWTPFFKERELYFSSNGLAGLGGHDIFVSKWTGGEWTNPENMRPGINSTADDFSLTWSDDWNTGAFLSNRPGGRFIRSETCCDDIYLVYRKPVAIAVEFETFSEKFQLKDVLIDVFASKNGVFEKVDSSSSKSYSHFISLDSEILYKFVARKDGHASDSMTINTVGVRKDTVFNYSFVLSAESVLDADSGEEIVKINEAIRLNNIYYDFDDDQILSDAEQDLEYLLELLNKYPEMVIELSSHTDSRGSDEYNKDLSKRRAQSAKRWLTEREVSPGRIRAIGYGETKLLNQCKNGVSCTEEEHRLNRRTEFKIVEGPTEILIEKKKFAKKKSVAASSAISKDINGPNINWERSFVDLGRIKRGESPEFVYKFKNDGTSDLLIEIVTGCECTELEWTTTPIKPGEMGEIKARLLSEEKDGNGQHNFDIDVVSNTEQLSHPLEYRAIIFE